MLDPTGLNQRARLSRALANILIHHSFPGCSQLLRNAYKLLGTPPVGPLQVPTRYGFNMLVDPIRNKGVDASVYYNGTYEAGTLFAITQALREGDVFIDAGANIGLMSLAAAQTVGPSGKVHAFEPVPGVYTTLTRNIAINGFKNISPHQKALGSASERKTIYEQEHINNGSASFVRPAAGSGTQHEVEIITLDEFINSMRIDRVRMIKADVEGWELDLLLGARTLLSGKRAPILCIEYSTSYSPRRETLLDVYDFIRSINKYEIFKLRHGKETISRLIRINESGDLPQHDNIFCFLPEHQEEIGSRLFI